MNDVVRLLEMSTQFALTAQTVSMRRLLQGSRRPGWSWSLESMTEFLRENMPRGEQIEAQQVRTLMSHLQHIPLGQNVTIQPAQEMPVAGEWMIPAGSQGPKRPSQEPVTLYVHGGGYIAGSPRVYRSLTAQLACDTGTHVFCMDYRLAPEHPYPAALEDALATYRWLLRNGTEPEQVALVGDSAGAGLIVALLCALRDEGEPMPAAAACLSPWVDLTCSRNSLNGNADCDYLNRDIVRACATMYCNGRDAADPTISPIRAELHGLPPLLVQIGTIELFFDETIEFAQRARAAGVEVELEAWDDMIHVWHMLYWLEPKAKQAVQHVARFVQKHVAERA